MGLRRFWFFFERNEGVRWADTNYKISNCDDMHVEKPSCDNVFVLFDNVFVSDFTTCVCFMHVQVTKLCCSNQYVVYESWYHLIQKMFIIMILPHSQGVYHVKSRSCSWCRCCATVPQVEECTPTRAEHIDSSDAHRDNDSLQIHWGTMNLQIDWCCFLLRSNANVAQNWEVLSSSRMVSSCSMSREQFWRLLAFVSTWIRNNECLNFDKEQWIANQWTIMTKESLLEDIISLLLRSWCRCCAIVAQLEEWAPVRATCVRCRPVCSEQARAIMRERGSNSQRQ